MTKILFFVGLFLVVFFVYPFVFASSPSDYGLKEGDLISAIFSDDPDVYIVNEHGYKRLFLNPEIFKFYSHLGGFANIKLVTQEIRDSFPTTGLFRNCEDNDQRVFGIDVEDEDVGQLHWVDTTGEQAVKDDPDFFKKVFCINKKEFSWYKKADDFKSVTEVPKYDRIPEEATVSTQEKIEAKTEFKDIGQAVICHYSPGNSSAFETITVGASAVRAHLEHGDKIGSCSAPIPTSSATPTLTTTPLVSVSPAPASSVSFSPTPAPTITSLPQITPVPAVTLAPTLTTSPSTTASSSSPTPTPTPTPSPTPTPTPTPTVTTSAGSGNSTLAVQRLFVGQFDNTKYNITIGDQDGIKQFSIGCNGICANYGVTTFFGGDPSCLTSVNSSTITLNPSDFPVSGYVIDCKNSTTKYTVQASMPALPTPTSTPTPTPITSSVSFDNFSRDLALGSRGDDVKQLQALLVNEVNYSTDLITGYFGNITRDAVKRFQEKYGVKPVSGYFGEITRGVLKALLAN